MKALFLALILMILLVPTLALGADNSYENCSDNTTLMKHIAYSDNGTYKFVDIPTDCLYGCSNVTNSCNPTPASQNLILFGVIVVVCILGALFWRWSR